MENNLQYTFFEDSGMTKTPGSVNIYPEEPEEINLFEPDFPENRTLLPGNEAIMASAGTGKTYNIQNLVVRLLLEKNIPIESIAVVTFTEAAADELKSRLRSVIDSCCSAALGKSSDKRCFSVQL